MATYVVTGVSRGLGWAFLSNLSSDSQNTVIGLVRNKVDTEERAAKEFGGRPNIHILQADMTDYKSLQKAAEDTSKITGGSLDYLIGNAAALPDSEAYANIGDLQVFRDSHLLIAKDPTAFEKDFAWTMQTNVIGNVHLIYSFLPLVMKGKTKKVIAISSGVGDIEINRKFDLEINPLYATSKSALNAIIAKFSAQYAKNGVLFMSICPGVVATNATVHDNATEEQKQKVGQFFGGLQRYAPNFTGPVPAEESVKDVLAVIRKSSLENGDGGSASKTPIREEVIKKMTGIDATTPINFGRKDGYDHPKPVGPAPPKK
ncbi:hypothetical protein F5Y16DRAFT_401597 [Xylariaceae sp. FL0255]|nr:hypothetical protein F5Y16DRAFT_401597 [Xylariaceae sp. FL0255]